MPRQIDQTVTDVRREIMDAASELFATEGYTSTSMRKIANKIGYSPTTIYLYFRDKDDLLRQICDATFAELTRNVNAINQLSGEPLDKLRLGLKEYILFGLRHPLHYHVLFEMNIPRQDLEPAAFDNTDGSRAFDTLRTSVAACTAANLLRTDEVELISQSLWGGIHGITSLLNNHPAFPWLDRSRVIETYLDILISGVKA